MSHLLKNLKVTCANCSLQQLCFPAGLDSNDFEKLDSIVKRSLPLARNSNIYLPGDPFTHLYAVRAGAIKTYSISSDGKEHVTGFYLPGEIIGLDAICSGKHPYGAKALETASLCEMPFQTLEELSVAMPSIARQLVRIMSKELHSDEQLLMMVGSHNAEVRLVSLFLSLSTRLHRRGYSATEFNLSMSRADISSFLGLAIETVCRLIKKLQDQGLIKVRNRQVSLLEIDKLRAIVDSKAIHQ